MISAWLWSVALATGVLLIIRLWLILPRNSAATKRSARRHSDHCSLAVFLGSGGHTSEALLLLSGLDFSRYSPRTYIVSCGDNLSERKAIALESLKPVESPTQNPNYSVVTIPRARYVHQSLLTTPLTAAQSFLGAISLITFKSLFSASPGPEVLILNGPGTCFVLCAAVYLNRLLGLPSPQMIYVESFARVGSLSLSGRLLRPLVDRFVVQWPQLLEDGKRGECRGWLV
ncbi:glycosyltransferase family 1 protein [Obba rivulosa]|uniref:UDP-N-acetylglucosamine transferase subunit ALG14 n=1 Tax=Obba rivulosa TaxID=1052685 RepID=A0A8E2B5F0_9APHY|nr:glycosyltransferase family 1 protein [Obba rivulosa]